MGTLYKPRTPALTSTRDLKTLVENRTIYSLNNCELNIFETHEKSEKVRLQFDSLVFTAMFRGKKIMHLNGIQPFEYLPGESVIVPGNEAMVIDFPEADALNPTQCLALAIDKTKISETLDFLNEKHAKVEHGDSWCVNPDQLHLKNSLELNTTIDRLVSVTREDNKAKDIFANFMLQELLIRLMQTQARTTLMTGYSGLATTSRFAFVIGYIKENLHQQITVDHLSKLACMSKPSFFRSFKKELGITPVEFITRERLAMAKSFLVDPVKSISDIVYRCGFNNVSYFCQLFKKHEGITPKEYKMRFVF